MAKWKKPKDLGLALMVVHESSYDSLSDRIREGLAPEIDSDGHRTTYEMVPMPGDHLLGIAIRRGVSPRTAAELLRKLADRLERFGGELLNMPRGGEGSFNARGEPEASPMQLPRGENGDLIVPDVE
jgi:hypothetical protein